jgi:hypothetical protein
VANRSDPLKPAMVTEVLVWALILANEPKRPVVEIYTTELLCRQDARELRKIFPDHPITCVPRRSMERPSAPVGRKAAKAE